MEVDYSLLTTSDAILCNNIEFLQFKHKKETDLNFMNSFKVSTPCGIRDVSKEYKLWTETFGTKVATCDEIIMTRGGNNHGYNGDFQPDVNNKACEYLMNPCQKNTFRNHLVEDTEKVCSLRHQMFNNNTKRR